MDWKEFYKFNVWKLIILLIIFIFPFFLFILSTFCAPTGFSLFLGHLFPISLILAQIFENSIVEKIILFNILKCSNNLILLLFVFLIFLTIYYTLSCLIYLGFKKLKK